MFSLSKLAQSLAVTVAISSAIIAVSGSPAPLAAADVETYSDPGNTTISKRQLVEIVDILIGGIEAYSSTQFQGLFNFGPPATCCDGWGDDCAINAGVASNGQPWQACYFPGSDNIYDFDVEVMQCLINLHAVQDDNCIDVAGSSCGADYGGGIMKGQVTWVGPGQDPSYYVDQQDLATMFAAALSLQNMQVTYDKGGSSALVVTTVADANGGGGIQFGGHQAQDC